MLNKQFAVEAFCILQQFALRRWQRGIMLQHFLLQLPELFPQALYQLVEQPLRRRHTDSIGVVSLKVTGLLATVLLGIIVTSHMWALNRASAVVLPGVSQLSQASNALAEPQSSIINTSNGPSLAPSDLIEKIKQDDGSVTRHAAMKWGEWRSLDATIGQCQLGSGKSFSEYPLSTCLPESPEVRVVVLGDSLGREGLLAIRAAGIEQPLAMASGSGCLPIYPRKPAYNPRHCRELNDHRFEYVSRSDVETVILNANWANAKYEEVTSTVDHLLALGKKVILFGPRPVFTEKVPTLLDSTRGNELAEDLSRYLRIDFDVRSLNQRLSDYAGTLTGEIIFVDQLALLCMDKCPAFLGSGELIYLDGVHLSPQAAAFMGRKMKPQLNGILAYDE